MALSNCINALAESHEKGRSNYIPYRSSKLTRLLKDSLGGNSRTVMIANVSPAASAYEDTMSTLKYASRAKNIKVRTVKNIISGDKDVSEYTKIVDALKRENQDLKNALEKAKESQSMSQDAGDNNNDHNTLVQAILQKINQHFELEIQFRKKLVDLDQKIFELDNKVNGQNGDQSQSQDDSDQTLIQIQEYNSQRESMMNQQLAYNNDRKELNSEIQNSGLPNIQAGFLMNVFYKRQTELEIISNKNLEEKTGKVIEYRDWIIKFLKQQAVMRDNIMTQQMVVLDSNEVRYGLNYDGLKKVTELPETLKSDSNFTLPPLFPDKQRRGQYASPHNFSKPSRSKFKLRQSENSRNFPNPGKKNFFGSRSTRGVNKYGRAGRYSSNRYTRPGQKRKRGNIFNKYRNSSINKYYNGNSKYANYNTRNTARRNLGKVRGKYYPRRGGYQQGIRSRYSGSVASLRYKNRPKRRSNRLGSTSHKSLNLSENSQARSTASYNRYRPYNKNRGRIGSGYSRPVNRFKRSPYLEKKFEKAGLGRGRGPNNRIYSGVRR